MNQTLLAPQFSHFINVLKNERWEYIAVFCLLVLLSLLLIYNLIFSAYDLSALVHSSNRQITTVTALQNNLNTTSAANTSTRMTSYHMFGERLSLISTVANSSYTLAGTAYSPKNKTGAKAFITSNGETRVYKVGDRLASGALVQGIAANEVLLINNGTEEKLTMSWENNTGNGATPAANSYYEPAVPTVPPYEGVPPYPVDQFPYHIKNLRGHVAW